MSTSSERRAHRPTPRFDRLVAERRQGAPVHPGRWRVAPESLDQRRMLEGDRDELRPLVVAGADLAEPVAPIYMRPGVHPDPRPGFDWWEVPGRWLRAITRAVHRRAPKSGEARLAFALAAAFLVALAFFMLHRPGGTDVVVAGYIQ